MMVKQSEHELRSKGYGKDLYNYMYDYAKKTGHSSLIGDEITSFAAMRTAESVGKDRDFKKAPNLQEFSNAWGERQWSNMETQAGLIEWRTKAMFQILHRKKK